MRVFGDMMVSDKAESHELARKAAILYDGGVDSLNQRGRGLNGGGGGSGIVVRGIRGLGVGAAHPLSPTDCRNGPGMTGLRGDVSYGLASRGAGSKCGARDVQRGVSLIVGVREEGALSTGECGIRVRRV
jgi:hypothetical protein